MTDHIKAARSIWGESAILPLADLERFWAMARNQALEDAAKVCETEWSNVAEKLYGQDCAAAIRARMKETP